MELFMSNVNESFKLGNRMVGPNEPPFIIAEMSGNHNQSLERALEIVDAAAETGVDALKIQTYTADTITLDVRENEFVISDEGNLWKGKSLYDLYKEAYTPWEWHEPIQKRCEEKGLHFFSTPFDHTAVDFLEELNVPFYKVASFENTDHGLIKKIAQTGKPMIMSTGMATVTELSEAVDVARNNGCENLVLLKCTSAYPASPKDANLNTIPHMSSLFDLQVGLSDHTLGIGVAVASVALGATVIEKHFTLKRADGGVDSAFSMEPAEMKALVEESRRAHDAMGKVSYKRSDIEEKSKKFRRSLYVSQDLKAGDVLSEENIRSVRPGFGLETKYLDIVLGRTIKKDAAKGTPLDWDLMT